MLCTVCGTAAYAIIHSLRLLALPSSTSYEDIISKLVAHLHPRPCVIIQRFQFEKRDQRPWESIANYVAELR